MSVIILPEKIKENAEQLEVLWVPDELRHDYFVEELWKDRDTNSGSKLYEHHVKNELEFLNPQNHGNKKQE